VHPWYHAYLFGTEQDDETYHRTTDWIEENFVIISHDVDPLTKLPTMEWYMESVLEAKGRYNIDISAIDPWNKLMHSRKPGESGTDYIGRALAEYYNMLKTYRMFGLINAHPVKPQKGDLKPPTAYDIDGSAHWYNAPEFVATVFRPDAAKTALSVSMEKTGRGRGSGVKGKRLLSFDPDINRYKTPQEMAWPPHMIQEMQELCEG
jgi:twinkle protein